MDLFLVYLLPSFSSSLLLFAGRVVGSDIGCFFPIFFFIFFPLTLWVSQTAFCVAGAPFCKRGLRPLCNSSFLLFCTAFLAALLLAVFRLLFLLAFLACSSYFLVLLTCVACFCLLFCVLSCLPTTLSWKKMQKWGRKKKHEMAKSSESDLLYVYI